MLLAVSVGVASFVLWPLLFHVPAKRTTGSDLSPLAELSAQREAILVALRDLDFDYSTGKLVEDDYRQQRAN
jgi:hypothetical protein